jgi:hypothetical protein
MAKKQTRRSISVSRATYERLKAFCETQGISMSQFVETRVGDVLTSENVPTRPAAPREALTSPIAPRPAPAPRAATAPRPVPPLTSVAARYAVEPPLPIIKPRSEPVDVKPPTPPTADQIFTF